MSGGGELPVVAFDFHCQRSGRCCSGDSGYVWVEEAELPALAASAGMGVDAFLSRHVRQVSDPRTGEPRLSLTESEAGGGRCSLLQGANECSVYEDRPEHCRSFPFWPSLLEDATAFERARATCPGIAVRVERERRERAFARLRELYAEVDAFVARARPVCILRGACCRFEEAGHELFATALEADFAAAQHPRAPAPVASGRCPYHVEGRCTARAGRPLGCRTYFCDSNTESVLAEAHEHFLRRLRQIEQEEGYPASYGRFPGQLAARGVGSDTTGSHASPAPSRKEPGPPASNGRDS